MHRRSLIRIALVATLVAVTAWSTMPAMAAEGDFIVDGGGWGHGVGMSQYGAYGMALDGMTVDEIIDTYYSGADLTPASEAGVPDWVLQSQALAVNVVSQRARVRFLVSGATVDVCQRGDGTACDEAVDMEVADGERLLITTADGITCNRVKLDAGGQTLPGTKDSGDCSFDLTWDDVPADPSAGPDTVVTAEGRFGDEWVTELTMARGPIHVRPNVTGPTIDATVRLGLQEYLYGIAEMPLSWEVEALKAQAVAARSYAAKVVSARGGADGSGRLAECGCHIRRTTADQVYSGWLVESVELASKWRSVVDGTAGSVVTHPQVSGGDAIVTTYYSSSTGGATEDVEDVFGGDPSPHLRSIDDPWSVDPAVGNPYAAWTQTIPNGDVADYLGWDQVRTMELVAGPPGSMVEVRGLDGGSPVVASLSGWTVRTAFGLRSPYLAGITKEGPPPPPFTDIEASIHYEDIGTIWRAGITKGCNPPANDLYCPEESVTRQQMASFLVRALDLPAAGEQPFDDVGGSVHASDIAALAAAGITKGCDPPANTSFCPLRPVTRAEMAAFLVRAYRYPAPSQGDLFTDDGGTIFEDDIDRLAAAGITKGCNPPTNDRYCPADPVTREQMASFLARAITRG